MSAKPTEVPAAKIIELLGQGWPPLMIAKQLEVSLRAVRRAISQASPKPPTNRTLQLAVEAKTCPQCKTVFYNVNDRGQRPYSTRKWARHIYCSLDCGNAGRIAKSQQALAPPRPRVSGQQRFEEETRRVEAVTAALETKTCKLCNKPFTNDPAASGRTTQDGPSQWANRQFCSTSCASRYSRTKANPEGSQLPPRTCDFCLETYHPPEKTIAFLLRNWPKRRFCCADCSSNYEKAKAGKLVAGVDPVRRYVPPRVR